MDKYRNREGDEIKMKQNKDMNKRMDRERGRDKSKTKQRHGNTQDQRE